jgi:hypothetical protein
LSGQNEISSKAIIVYYLGFAIHGDK